MSRLSRCILGTGLLLVSACEHAPTGAPEPQPTTPAVALTAVPVPGGIVSWLPGDGNPDDIVGTNDGTLVNGATYGTGLVGQAFLLDESQDQYVNLGNDPSLHLSAGGDFSMEAWVKFNSLSDDMSILDKMAAPSGVNSDGWRLLKQRDGRFWFCLGGGSNTCGARAFTLFSLSTVSTGTWYHVAAVVDAASGTFSLYVDGALQETQPLPGFVDSNSSDLRLGLYATEPFSDLDGFIDEATFYGSALTGAQVQAIYNAGSDGKEKEEPNSPPQIGADGSAVMVDEGQTASNTGTLSDADGDVVALAASVGTIVNENDGTWSWSFDTTDGPAESLTVTIDADDGNGGTAQTSFQLTVGNVAPTIASITLPSDPVAIGDQSVSASGTFSDPAGAADETYTCTVDYGDGSGPLGGTVSSGTTCTGPGHTYADAGVYQLTVTVVDKDGGTASLTAETFLVIYDPSGGFVTGGGWIDSPPGAYVGDPVLTGKANFGFVSRYKRGATIPTGSTEFHFKAGDLNFHSSTYRWLVVNQGGTNAQFRGSGTINGTLAPNGMEYQFMIWAGDGSPDSFRIRIWEEDGSGAETDVYDNGFDQELGGGSVVIHTKK